MQLTADVQVKICWMSWSAVIFLATLYTECAVHRMRGAAVVVSPRGRHQVGVKHSCRKNCDKWTRSKPLEHLMSDCQVQRKRESKETQRDRERETHTQRVSKCAGHTLPSRYNNASMTTHVFINSLRFLNIFRVRVYSSFQNSAVFRA